MTLWQEDCRLQRMAGQVLKRKMRGCMDEIDADERAKINMQRDVDNCSCVLSKS